MQPVPVCLVAYILGMLAGSFQEPGASPFYVWLFLAASLLLWVFLRQSRPASMLLLLLVFFLVGLLRYPLQLTPPADLTSLHHYSGPTQVIVEGTVLRVNPRGPDRSSIDLQVAQLSYRGIATSVSGRLRLYFGAGQPTSLLHGDRVRFRSRLRRTRVFGTPGEFNMPRHLAYSGIWTTAYLADVDELVRMAGTGKSFMRGIDRWRMRGRELVEDHVSAEFAPLVRSLALGERGGMTEEQRHLLARGGVSHLFAISGLHMGLLALFGYQALLYVYRRSHRLLNWQPPQRVIPLLLLPLLFVYLLLTGDALSTRRAFATCLCVAAVFLWRRRVAPMQLLFTLAFLFLLVEPLALWQVSFQLSFAGVAGILCWQRYWQLSGFRRHWLLKKLLQIFLVSLAATLATAPLVIMTFHLFAPAGLINNLFAIPLVTLLAVPAGLGGLFFSPLWPALAGTCFSLCAEVLQNVIRLTGWISDLPGLGGQMFYLSREQVVIVAGIALVLLAPWKRLFWLFLIAPLLILLLIAPAPTLSSGLSLTVFSVGQGESMLLSLDGGPRILIDGGGLYSDSFDVGERLVAPALGLAGVRQLDAVLLTHNHPDHSKGLIYLLQHFSIKSFWCGDDADSLSVQLRNILTQQNVPVERFPPGWSKITLDQGSELSLYVPELQNGLKNDRSVALYAHYGEDGLLLTGDLEQAGTSALLASGVPGPVSLLKLPHHGSRHSGSRQFLEHLKPRKVVVSVGYQNHYQFPADEVVAEVLESGAEIYRTDLSGTLRFDSQGQGWQVSRWQSGLFR